MYTVYFIFFQVASATATRFGLSRGLLGLQYDKINESESETCTMAKYPTMDWVGENIAESFKMFKQQMTLIVRDMQRTSS